MTTRARKSKAIRITGDRVLVEWLHDLPASETIVLTDSGPRLAEYDNRAWPVRVWRIGSGKLAQALCQEIDEGGYALAKLGSAASSMLGPHSRVMLQNARELADRVGAKNECVIIDADEMMCGIEPPRPGEYR